MSERIECVEILENIFNQKVFYNTVKNKISPKNMAFCNMLVLSVLRNYGALDKIIAKFVIKKFTPKNKILKFILLCGITELMLLESPDYAVINEYVNIAKKKTDKFAANMVNAVLRNVARQKKDLSLNAIIPDNFRKILEKDYSKEQIQKISEVSVKEPPLDVSVKENYKFWEQELNGVLLANGTIRINNAKSKISELKGYDEGAWWVQDLAASLPVMLLGDIKGKKVLDLCAAPGGKTAQLLSRGALVTAVDIDESRMCKLQENMARLKLEENLTTQVCDGAKFLENNQNIFDVIVLDAPCSATGTFRKHPEVLLIKNFADVKNVIQIQEKLLEKAAAALKTGGTLLYCTCSITKIEGEEQIKKFVKNNQNFEFKKIDMSKINLYNEKKIPEIIIDNTVLRTLPYYMEDMGGMDSFFAACLLKK